MSSDRSFQEAGSSGSAQITEGALVTFAHAHISLQQTPCKGVGVFATSDILPGTLILIEMPLAVSSDRDGYDDAVESLSQDDLAALRQLYPGPQATLSDIWKHNAWGTTLGSFLYKITCRFNHSCMPSINLNLDNTGQTTMWTAKFIKAGEELTVCYRGDFILMTAEERAVKIKETWNFVCDCPACNPPMRGISDMRRQIIRGIIVAVGITYTDGEVTNLAPREFTFLYGTAWELMLQERARDEDKAKSHKGGGNEVATTRGEEVKIQGSSVEEEPGLQPSQNPEYWFLLGPLLYAEKSRDSTTIYAYSKAIQMLRGRVEGQGASCSRVAFVQMYDYITAQLELYSLFPDHYHTERNTLEGEQAEFGTLLGYVEFVGQGDMD